MSTINSANIQVGQSVTPANNITLSTDGSGDLLISKGNAGALVEINRIKNNGMQDAAKVSYTPAGTGAVATDVQSQLRSLGEVVSTFTELRALKKSSGKTAIVFGASAKNDGNGGNYYYDSTDTTSTDNGDSVIVATDGGVWKRQPNKTASGKVSLGYRPLQSSGLAYATNYEHLIPAFAGLAWGGFPEYGACFDNDGYLWVPLHGSYSTTETQASAIPGGAAKIDTVTGTIVGIWRPASKALGFYSLACCPTTGEIWATDGGCIFSDIGEQVGHVFVIDPVTLTTVNTTNCVTGEHPGHVIFDPSTSSMIVCNGEAGLLSSGAKINTLTKYNSTTYANISTSASLGSGLTQSVYCPDDGYVWVTCYVSGTVRPVNTSTMTAVVAGIATDFGGVTGGNPIGIVFDTITRSLWTANNVTQNVTRINPLTQSTTMMVTGATHFDPYKIEFVPETGLLMLSNYSGSTDFIDPVSCSVIASINQNAAGYRNNGAIHDPINGCAWNLVNTGPNGPSIQRIQPPLNYSKRVVAAAVNAGGAAQSIPSGALTQVVFSTKDFDPTGCYSTSTNRFTPGIKGIFRIAANLFFGGLATTSTTAFLTIYKNGSQYKDGCVNHPSTAGGSCGLEVDALVHSNLATDYFDIYVFQDGGASVNTNGLSRLTYASCSQVSIGQVGNAT